MEHRRGRRSRDDYIGLVISLLRADIWRLKDERALAEHPGVKALAPQFAGEAWPVAWALHALIAGAVADISAAAYASRTRSARRAAEFLQLWYDEQRTVASIAAGMQLTRAHVAKMIQRPTLVLVAQRVLALAEGADPIAASDGVRHVLSTCGRHNKPRRACMGRASPRARTLSWPFWAHKEVLRCYFRALTLIAGPISQHSRPLKDPT